MSRKILIKPQEENRFLQQLKKYDDYFTSGDGDLSEKLSNFAKYVSRQTLTTFLVKYEIFKKILNIHGSIVECGVNFGGGIMTFAKLSSIFEPVNYTRKIIGFDSFSGFPSVSKYDNKNNPDARKGGLYSDSLNDIKNSIAVYDTDRFVSHIPKVELIKGNALRTIPKYVQDNPHLIVSLLYCDFDLYEPTKIALKNFVPRMPKGSVIAFDELNNDKWAGETKALLNTLGVNKLKIERFSFDSRISYAILD